MTKSLYICRSTDYNMASINTSEITHLRIRNFSFHMRESGTEVNIGDVTDFLWSFVETHHMDAFEEYVRNRE